MSNTQDNVTALHSTKVNEPAAQYEDIELAEGEYPEAADAETAPYNSMLKVYKEVLAPAFEERKAPPTANWSNRMVAQYPCLEYKDVQEVHDRYYNLIIELIDVLHAELDTVPPINLEIDNAPEDMEANRHHYLNLLLNWQLTIHAHELDWRCTDEHAAAEIAAVSETHKMFFGQNGLTEFLAQSGFRFTTEDQSMLQDAMFEMREGRDDR